MGVTPGALTNSLASGAMSRTCRAGIYGWLASGWQVGGLAQVGGPAQVGGKLRVRPCLRPRPHTPAPARPRTVPV